MTDCGIYIIECLATGHVYVGSSTRIKARWKDHRSQLNRGIHHSSKLQEYWDAFGEEEFKHEIIEPVPNISTWLEARESHWIKVYQKDDLLLNTSSVTFNPMRNKASVKKMLKTRGDSQKGAKASSAKLSEEQYLQIVYALASTTYSPEDLSDYFGLSPRSIRDIQKGTKHKWIAEQYPEQFNIMFHWRKNLRIFRSTDASPPVIELPIDTSFMTQLHSFRRDYAWNTDAKRKKLAIDKAIKQSGDASEIVKLKKEQQKLGRIVKPKTRKPWISLIHTKGEELKFYSVEEATAYGLDVKYLTQLKNKKLLRYKGWRINK